MFKYPTFDFSALNEEQVRALALNLALTNSALTQSMAKVMCKLPEEEFEFIRNTLKYHLFRQEDVVVFLDQQ